MLGEADDMKGSPSDIDQPATPPERPRCKNRLRPFPVFVLFRPRGNSRTSAFSAKRTWCARLSASDPTRTCI